MDEVTTWRVEPLGKLLIDMQPGFAQRPIRSKEGTPQLRTNNVSPDGVIDLSNLDYVKVKPEEKEKYGVRPGDVIFNNTNSLTWVGKTAYFNLEGEFVLSNHMTRLRVQEDLLDARFLSSYLYHLWKIGFSKRKAKQWVNQSAIDQIALARFPIPLPPLSEQRQIVAILNKVEEVRRLRRVASDRAGEILSALFYDMFGEPDTNSKSWRTVPLRELIVDTPQNGLYKHNSSYGSGTPIVRINNFYGGRLHPAETFQRLRVTNQERATYGLRNGDILINRVNSPEFLGKTALVEGLKEPTVFESNMMRIQVDENGIAPYYLNALLNTNYAKRYFSRVSKPAVNQSSINQQDVLRFAVPLPDKTLISEFERIVANYNLLPNTQSSLQGAIDNLFFSVQAHAFQGELTTAWRETHSELLAHETAERDRLLNDVRTITPVAQEETEERCDVAGRETLLREMGNEQQRLLQHLRSVQGDFTPESLLERDGFAGDFQMLGRSLEFLAVTGLLRRVRVQPQTGVPVTVPAYRWPRPDDDARDEFSVGESDLQSFDETTDVGVEIE